MSWTKISPLIRTLREVFIKTLKGVVRIFLGGGVKKILRGGIAILGGVYSAHKGCAIFLYSTPKSVHRGYRFFFWGGVTGILELIGFVKSLLKDRDLLTLGGLG